MIITRSTHDIDTIGYIEEILSIIRHQLGNSVNSLKITLDVLQGNFNEFDDEKKKEYLERGSALLGKQEALIEAMKAYSKYNAKDKKEMGFVDFWESLLNAVIRKLEKHGIKLMHSQDTGRCRIKTDSMALHKIMMNIVDNAIDAFEEINGGIIELTAKKNNDSVLIQIKDNGCGIKKRDMPRIFIPLFTTKAGKMGMGLPVAQKLITEMDGHMEIESPFGTGTEARIWLRAIYE